MPMTSKGTDKDTIVLQMYCTSREVYSKKRNVHETQAQCMNE